MVNLLLVRNKNKVIFFLQTPHFGVPFSLFFPFFSSFFVSLCWNTNIFKRMDTSIHSFSTHALFKQPIVITHLVSMVIAFLGCYPLLLTRQLRKRKVAIISLSCIFCTIGFITGYFIQTKQDTASLVLHIFGFILLCLVIAQCIFHFLIKPTKWVDLILGWAALIVAFCYLVVSAVVFTDSCQNDMGPQCFMPLAMGVGFLMYGSFTLLHLLAIIKLPRPATPEYYESVIITSWGLISLILSGITLRQISLSLFIWTEY